MIELKNIVKKYGDNIILNDVSLTIKRSEVVSIIGPSGGGKSTLLRCINYLEIPDSGSVIIDGKLATLTTAEKLRQQVGMVFQSFNLFPHMSILENLTYAPIKVKKLPVSKAESKALNILKQFGLENKATSYPRDLSGGQKQRVAIARALAMEPEYILFDEPTSALDPEFAKEVLDTIKSLGSLGITIVLVTHEMSFAKSISDRIVFLENGQIIEIGTPYEIFDNPQNERIKTFINKMEH